MKKSLLLSSMIAISLVLVSAFPVAAVVLSKEAADAISKCDRFAASPIDIQKPKNIPGVPFERMEKFTGKMACQDAIRTAPKSILPRMEFQWARSLEKIEAYSGIEEAYKKAAKHHYIAAYTALGWMYYSGKSVHQNFKKAFEWYEKGAKAGDPTAMNNISIMYVKGIGVAKDKSKANYWYQKALENGIAKTDTLVRRESERVSSLGYAPIQLSVDKAYAVSKGWALERLHKCSEGGEWGGVLDESSVEYDKPVCETLTETQTYHGITSTIGEPTYRCKVIAHGTCMHALLREGDIKPKPLFEWTDERVSNAIALLDSNTAREDFRRLVDDFGEAKVLELSEKVYHTPRRNGYYLADGGAALQCGSKDPKVCLEHLFAFEKIKKMENDQDLNALQNYASGFDQDCRWPAQADVDPSDCPIVRKIRKAMKHIKRARK